MDPADPAPDLLRERLHLPPEARIALYHGGFSPDRGLEQLADAVLEPGMEAVHAVFLGFGSEQEKMERMAVDPRFGGRVHVVDAVPPTELLPWVASADVAVMCIQPSTLNHRSSTRTSCSKRSPRRPVVASDFDEMRAIVLGNPEGPLSESAGRPMSMRSPAPFGGSSNCRLPTSRRSVRGVCVPPTSAGTGRRRARAWWPSTRSWQQGSRHDQPRWTGVAMRIVSVVGTRPQLIKAAALAPVLRREHHEVFVDTGQHWDQAMAGAFFDELDLPRPDHTLGVGGGTHGEQTARMLERLEPIIVAEWPDAVLVYGDTNSTLAGALAAAKLGIRWRTWRRGCAASTGACPRSSTASWPTTARRGSSRRRPRPSTTWLQRAFARAYCSWAT